MRLEFPEYWQKIEFLNYSALIWDSFVIYADFELTLKRVHGNQPNPKQSYSSNIQEHVSNSWCVYTK